MTSPFSQAPPHCASPSPSSRSLFSPFVPFLYLLQSTVEDSTGSVLLFGCARVDNAESTGQVLFVWSVLHPN